eukprot:COSAG05_NODE_1394_length_4994_cov_33.750358_2_plen_432_part_00
MTVHTYPWALPPSSAPSVPILIVLMALVLVGSIAVYLHGRDGNQWRAEQGCCTDSAFACMPAWVLAVYRLAAAAVGAWQLSGLFVSGSEWVFCAYTIWNMSLLTVYFTVGVLNYLAARLDMKCGNISAGLDIASGGLGITAGLEITARQDLAQHLVPASQRSSLRPLEKAQLVLFAIELPAALLVTFVFWTVLAPQALSAAEYEPNCTPAEALAQNETIANCTKHRDEERLLGAEAGLVSVNNLVQHAANSAMMVLEMMLNKLQLRPLYGVFVGLWALTYSAFAIFLWFPFTHLWVYSFLNTATMEIIPWQLGLLIGHWVLYFMCYCVSLAKFRCTDRGKGMALGRSVQGQTPFQQSQSSERDSERPPLVATALTASAVATGISTIAALPPVALVGGVLVPAPYTLRNSLYYTGVYLRFYYHRYSHQLSYE